MKEHTPEAEPVYEQVEMRSGDAEAIAWFTKGYIQPGQEIVYGDATWTIIAVYPFEVTAEQFVHMPHDARVSQTHN